MSPLVLLLLFFRISNAIVIDAVFSLQSFFKSQLLLIVAKRFDYAIDLGESQSTEENKNSTRTQREINERERRLIPYMTFYVAQSYQNPNSGERQNVLIPIQGMQENIDHYSGVPQLQTNNIQNVNQQYQLIPRAVMMRLQEAGLLPTSPIQIPTEYKPRPHVAAQVYGFRSPGPQPQLHPYQHQSLQQIIKPNQLKPSNPKYLAPQLIKLIPVNSNYHPDERPKMYVPRPQNTYTSTKLQSYLPNSYFDENYYKEEYQQPNAIDLLTHAGKLNYQRPRYRQEKAKIYLSTTQSPYTNKVKFELEDARIPSIAAIQLEQIKTVNVNQDTTPVAYEQQNPGLSEYLEAMEKPATDPPNQSTYYGQDLNEQVTYVPVRSRPPETNAQPLIQQIPVSQPQAQQIRYVQEINTPSPQIPENNDIGHETPQTVNYEEEKPNVENVLSILKETNQLPQNFTPDNIDGSVKTLALILGRLKQPDKKNPKLQAPQKHTIKPKPSVVIVKQEEEEDEDHHDNKIQSYPQPSGTSTPGRPGVDYPIYSTIPQTRFDCSTQRYKGFFGDPETHCQVWHYCDLNGGQASFLCPNGTIFSQVALTCDWWFNVKCATTSQLYVLNERLYKYILPFSPSFPEDYSGPLVDRYLTAKFKEMEAKSKLKALKSLITTPQPETSTSSTPQPTTSESAQPYESDAQ